jgi:hypothetical protein
MPALELQYSRTGPHQNLRLYNGKRGRVILLTCQSAHVRARLRTQSCPSSLRSRLLKVTEYYWYVVVNTDGHYSTEVKQGLNEYNALI